MSILNTSAKNIMETSFINYAMSVITDRALPDLRDGLKPVHRRILFAMHESGNDHNKPYKKSARMVGDVIGKYHPHGDSSVYGAAVRMAQPFSMREVLIDGQGNFGSIDGDSPAAMRYTEMRLTKLSSEMFNDLRKETIHWEDNYDGQEKMPSVLTTPFCNLLLGGVDGIAVGMASSIPPHNLGAVCDATISLIDQGDLTARQMLEIMSAPDFPTGGLVYGVDGFLSAIEKGNGRLKLRSKYVVEDRGRGASRLVITEIPYQVNKSKLITKIADLVRNKDIADVSGLRDESSKEGIRVAIDLKAGADADVMFSTLCKLTELETSINYNCTVLDKGIPKQIGLLEILKKWLVFRQEVVTARYVFERKKALEKLHILTGLIKALDRLDEVIALIRAAKDGASAKSGLVELLAIDEIQAQSILDMRLQKLTGLEINDIRQQFDDLTKRVAELTAIIESPEKILAIIREEQLDIKAKYATPRLTEIGHGIESITTEDLIEREDVLITVTKNGYIKRIPASSLVKQNRGTRGRKALTLDDGDEINAMYSAHSHDTLMVFTQSGQVHGIKCYQIPEGAMTAKGRHINNVIEGLEGEIAAIVNIPEDGTGKSIVVVTSDGTVKRSSLDVYNSATRKGGVRGVNIEDENTVVGVFVCKEHDHIMLTSNEGMAIRFDVSDMREMGRTATGVRGIKLSALGEVVGAYVIEGDGNELPMHTVQRERGGEVVPVEELDTSKMDEGKFLVCIGEKGVGKRTSVSEFSVQSRGGKGSTAFKVNKKTGLLKAAIGTTIENDLILFASNGVSNRIKVVDIREAGRATSGVILINLDAGATLNSVALSEPENEDID